MLCNNTSYVVSTIYSSVPFTTVVLYPLVYMGFVFNVFDELGLDVETYILNGSNVNAMQLNVNSL